MGNFRIISSVLTVATLFSEGVLAAPPTAQIMVNAPGKDPTPTSYICRAGRAGRGEIVRASTDPVIAQAQIAAAATACANVPETPTPTATAVPGSGGGGSGSGNANADKVRVLRKVVISTERVNVIFTSDSLGGNEESAVYTCRAGNRTTRGELENPSHNGRVASMQLSLADGACDALPISCLNVGKLAGRTGFTARVTAPSAENPCPAAPNPASDGVIATSFASASSSCVGSATRFQKGYRIGEEEARKAALRPECAGRSVGRPLVSSGRAAKGEAEDEAAHGGGGGGKRGCALPGN